MKVLGYKKIRFMWSSPHHKYHTHWLWKYILLGLDRIGFPLYYHTGTHSIGRWRITKRQKEIMNSLLLSSLPLDGESSELLRTLSHSSHYNGNHKRFLNLLLFQYWEFFGREEVDIPKEDKENPYPPHLEWKLTIDNLFKWEVEPIYEYE